MKCAKFKLTLIALIAAMASAAAWADHGGGFHHAHGHRGHIGVFIGGPLFWPWYYPPAYYPYYPYAYPPLVVAPSTPPVYVEQGEQQAAPAPQAQFWYYCENQGYYPSVKDCPVGWQQVPARPPRS